jgi:nicotinamidase-related amidase
VSTALIVIDMLNTYDHEDAEPLTKSVEDVVTPLQRLISETAERDECLVYVQDNFGDWSAGRPELIRAALNGAAPHLVEPIVPRDDVPFVVKARHSIFYQTPLEYLLRSNDIDRIVLAGQVTEQCILYSALDAYVRSFEVVVPRDAVAHIDEVLADAALRMMESNMRAEIRSARDCVPGLV